MLACFCSFPKHLKFNVTKNLNLPCALTHVGLPCMCSRLQTMSTTSLTPLHFLQRTLRINSAWEILLFRWQALNTVGEGKYRLHVEVRGQLKSPGLAASNFTC